MPWKSKKNSEKVASESAILLLKSAQIELNREVRRKLTYEYLGIWTGTLRNTTGAVINNGVLYFGTAVGYGYGFETGNWKKVEQKGSRLYSETYQAARLRRCREADPKWRGQYKRPFMLDTIRDEGVQARIIGRVKRANV